MLLSMARFLLLGAACFAAVQLWHAGAGPERLAEPIRISERQIERLRGEWSDTWSAGPSELEMKRLIEREIDDEVLHREALRLGLHRADPVVRQRLVENMRFLGQAEGAVSADDASLYRQAVELGMVSGDLVVRRRLIQQMTALFSASAQEPAEDELRAYVDRHPERFSSSRKLRLSYVFVGAREAAKIGPAESAELLAALSRFEDAPERTRPALPHPVRSGVFTQTRLIRRFGAPLAAELTDLSPGQWAGPFAHDDGRFWIRLDELIRSAPAQFELVEDRARHVLLQERRDVAVADALRRLRRYYEVHVAGSVVEERRSS